MESESNRAVGSGIKMGDPRAEIDTSAPFESVKEAVNKFGGIGFWKPSFNQPFQPEHNTEDVIDIAKLEEQAAHLEKDLILKEREALNVLEKLELTKTIVEELKSKLQKETHQVNTTLKSNTAEEEADKENHHCSRNLAEILSPRKPSPGLILMELKQAKLNLTRTTNDIADIRTSVESFNKKLEKEKILLQKTREQITKNLSKISSLEEELNQTRLKLQIVKDAEVNGGLDNGNPLDISKTLQQLNSEAERFKIMEEEAKSEVLRSISEIEQMRAKIKTAEIKLIAARKMKEAARAQEAVALAEIKVRSSHENQVGITLSYDEYVSLTRKAQQAEELSKRKITDAMQKVDEANVSKMEILKRIDEASEEVQTSKKVLEEALNRIDAAYRAKLSVEEALRKWRSENGRKKRSVRSTTKFKNSCSANNRRDSHLLDVNGMDLINDGPTPILKPTLSIGQILSRKLLLPEELESGVLAEKSTVKQRVSLGQMLGKPNGDFPASSCKDRSDRDRKKSFGKIKKIGFAQFSLLLAKKHKKKEKKTGPNRK